MRKLFTLLSAIALFAIAQLGFAPSAAADTTTTTSPEAVTVTAQPTPAPAEVCNERVDASINGQSALVRNWNSDKPCIVSAVAYVRTTDAMFPQTRVNIDTATVPPMGQVTLLFGNNDCVQKDAIYGSDAPIELTGNYFSPAGTLLTADDSGLWKDGCEPTTTTTSTTVTTTTTPPADEVIPPAEATAPPTTTTQPPAPTTPSTNPPTVTVSVCGPNSPYWNPTTGSCQLPFTGSETNAIISIAIILLYIGGFLWSIRYWSTINRRTQAFVDSLLPANLR